MTKANPNRSVALIKGSKGGTSLRMDWRPGERGKPETQGGCYHDFIETIRIATDELTSAGHRFEIRGLLWHQGESDSKSSAKVHHRRLLELMDRIRDEVGLEDLPVVVGEVFDNGKRDSVRAALRAVGNSGPRFGLVSSAGTKTSDEGTHFDAASQILLGQRYAAAMLEIENANQR
jgi:iduronate 2-sulfatase